MTNMKDRLRPHRGSKVRFQTKTRNINLKAKEKIAVKKNATNNHVAKFTSRRNVNNANKNNAVVVRKTQRVSKPKKPMDNVAPKKSPKQKSVSNNKVKAVVKSPRCTRKNTLLNNIKPNSDAPVKSPVKRKASQSRLLNSHITETVKRARLSVKNEVKEEDVENNNNKKEIQRVVTKERRKRVPKKKNEQSAVTMLQKACDKTKAEFEMSSDGKVWEKAYFVVPVNGKVEFVTYKRAQTSTIRKLSDKPRHHKCNICNKAFLGKNDLRKHSLIHYGLLPFECKKCFKRFRQAGNLRNHVVAYHPDTVENLPKFTCDYCKKEFLIKERLRLHMRIHTGFKPYKCGECPMRFARSGQLNQHARTHTGEKNYQCDICKGMFTSKAKLKMHVDRHYNIKNYTCYVCGKRFLRLDSFKQHLSCYHNDEKHFECSVCKKKLKGHLAEHMRTHSSERPHACNVCESKFVQRSQLTVHQRLHSGARPYRCRVCWKAFAHSTALTLHTRHHTGEKPFPCRICATPFSQLSHLKKHMQTLHGDARAYIHLACKEAFHTKMQLDKHLLECTAKLEIVVESPEEALSRKIAESFQPSEPLMALTKMRLLLAVLLKKICSKQKLQRLGFNKRLVDDILLEALETSSRAPCTDPALNAAQRLKVNVQKFLEWTVPSKFMDKFREENKSTEELLEELTS